MELDELIAVANDLKDRREIFDCVQRESRGRDRQDAEQINSCWWEDGLHEHGTHVTSALDHAENANTGHHAAFLMTSHNITNHLCEIVGSTATCESYVIGGLLWRDGKTTTMSFGRYLDRLEKRNGEWRLLVRRCTIEMTANSDASWAFSGGLKGFLKGVWGKNDPSYERPIVARQQDKGVRW